MVACAWIQSGKHDSSWRPFVMRTPDTCEFQGRTCMNLGSSPKMTTTITGGVTTLVKCNPKMPGASSFPQEPGASSFPQASSLQSSKYVDEAGVAHLRVATIFVAAHPTRSSSADPAWNLTRGAAPTTAWRGD